MVFGDIGRGINRLLHTFSPEGRKERDLKKIAWESVVLFTQQGHQDPLVEYEPNNTVIFTQPPLNPGAILRLRTEDINGIHFYDWYVVSYEQGDRRAHLYLITTNPKELIGYTQRELKEELMSRLKTTGKSLAFHPSLQLKFKGRFRELSVNGFTSLWEYYQHSNFGVVDLSLMSMGTPVPSKGPGPAPQPTIVPAQSPVPERRKTV
jgi:hypothetical protein